MQGVSSKYFLYPCLVHKQHHCVLKTPLNKLLAKPPLQGDSVNSLLFSSIRGGSEITGGRLKAQSLVFDSTPG